MRATRDISIHGFAISNAPVDDLAAAARVINDRLARGRLHIRVGDRLPLAAAAHAHHLQERSHRRPSTGRIVVLPEH